MVYAPVQADFMKKKKLSPHAKYGDLIQKPQNMGDVLCQMILKYYNKKNLKDLGGDSVREI